MSEVWVIAEQRLGKLMNVSFELLGKGTELAKKLKVKLAAVLLGDNVRVQADELACYGADRVYLGDDPKLRFYQSEVYADLIAKLISAYKPQIVLIGATSIGRDLAPRIAAKLKTGLTAHCVELDIIDEGGERPQLVQVVPGWGGNLMVSIACPVKRPQIATVSPGVMTKCDRRERKGEIVKLALDVQKESRVETLEMVEEESAEVTLEEADVVVAGGWGLFSAGGFEPIEELAKVVGGAVAGTRPALDRGWIPDHRMIGQSGKTVSPKLLISVGASGAPQFTTGFLKAKVVLAIDQNPNAPIFDVADIGLVGDLCDILPCLVSELKETGLRV
ncbi:MAG: electron transfer flavoprotein subunit alpha/FixB family protein [Chloroflexi bacterium]|nr:electron transfer flavoprotein subunit alpha/FixB family protein [Chloroflexota bacterium]